MPITFKEGNMFTHDPTIKAYAHGCNAAGVMGAGVARQIRSRFPWAYQEYVKLVNNKKATLGSSHLVTDGNVWVFNLMTQASPGPYAREEYIKNALEDMIQQAPKAGVSRIALPLIGAGLGGLDIKTSIKLLKAAGDKATDVELVVYSLATNTETDGADEAANNLARVQKNQNIAAILAFDKQVKEKLKKREGKAPLTPPHELMTTASPVYVEEVGIEERQIKGGCGKHLVLQFSLDDEVKGELNLYPGLMMLDQEDKDSVGATIYNLNNVLAVTVRAMDSDHVRVELLTTTGQCVALPTKLSKEQGKALLRVHSENELLISLTRLTPSY